MKEDITVIMVVRNEEEYVKATITSILNQTYKKFKFIIIDDGSTDKTWSVIKSIKDKRILVIKHDQRSYLTKNLNEALKLTKTPFVARMDSHNTCNKFRLEKQRDFMLSHPEAALVGSNYIKIDESGKQVFKSDFFLDWQEIKSHILEKNQFKHASWFGRYELLMKENFYDEDYRFSQDYEFLLRLIPKYPVYNMSNNFLTEIKIAKAMSQSHRYDQAMFVLKAQIKSIIRLDYPVWQWFYILRTIGYVLNSAKYQFLHRNETKTS